LRRKYGPFNNERFVGNAKTMEVHDLDGEKSECEIDFMDHEHIITYGRDRLTTFEGLQYNLCPHCISPESLIKHNWYR
jgi:hypothetical protein